jgi:serine/threonine protein kinase
MFVANIICFSKMSYTFGRELGRGSSGTVYLATDKNTGKEVTIKVLVDRSSADKEMEVLNLVGCRYPNLLCLLEWFIDSRGRLNLVYDYLGKTKDLFACLYTNPRDILRWSDTKVLRMMYGMCQGLKDLHDNGILHLDLKPENIIIKNDEIPVIIDYDLSCIRDECEDVGVAGTRGYIAPELFLGEAATAKSDVFGLGGVFFSIVTDELPPSLEDMQSLLSGRPASYFNIVRCKYFSTDLKKILAGMLKRNPSNRWDLASVMSALAKMMHSSDESSSPLVEAPIPSSPSREMSRAFSRTSSSAYAPRGRSPQRGAEVRVSSPSPQRSAQQTRRNTQF